jgi:multicomponent Na+:H+ antiporter subunit F
MILVLVLVVLSVGFFAALVRVAIGPTVADRTVAADVCLFCAVAAMAVLSVLLEDPAFLAGVLVATCLGFLATMSLARLIGRRGP